MALGERFFAQLITNLVVNCPLFLVLGVGLVVGLLALVRSNRLAGCLALVGFALLGLLLLLSTVLGGAQVATLARDQGLAVTEIGSMLTVIGCVRSLVEMVALLCIVGAIAVYAFQAREPTSPAG